MDNNTIDREIEKNDIAISAQISALNYVRKKIIIEIKPFVLSELKRLIEKEVSRNSRHTKSLTKEKLREMKKKFLKMLETSNDQIDMMFADDKLWFYTDYKVLYEGNLEQVYDDQKIAEEYILDAIGLALGQAGQLLIDYGYEKVEAINALHADYVLNDYIIFNNKRIAYRAEMTLPASLTALLKEYCQKIAGLHTVLEKDLKLKRHLTAKEALDLWSEV